jgi:hypothetical protein
MLSSILQASSALCLSYCNRAVINIIGWVQGNYALAIDAALFLFVTTVVVVWCSHTKRPCARADLLVGTIFNGLMHGCQFQGTYFPCCCRYKSSSMQQEQQQQQCSTIIDGMMAGLPSVS